MAIVSLYYNYGGTTVKSKKWLLDSAKKQNRYMASCTPARLREYVDYDYLSKLSESELEWLATFTDAYYTGAKNEVSKDWNQEEMSKSYLRNNARNREVFIFLSAFEFNDNMSKGEAEDE